MHKTLLLGVQFAPHHRSLTLALAVLGSLVAVSPAAAQGSPQQRAACENDAMRVCGQHVPDVNRITNCMIQNHKRLSPACRASMQPPGKKKRRGG
jgi:hypothetical protein